MSSPAKAFSSTAIPWTPEVEGIDSPKSIVSELQRCDREIEAYRTQEDGDSKSAVITTLGIEDWEAEKRLILGQKLPGVGKGSRTTSEKAKMDSPSPAGDSPAACVPGTRVPVDERGPEDPSRTTMRTTAFPNSSFSKDPLSHKTQSLTEGGR
jgi:hypothetical protein